MNVVETNEIAAGTVERNLPAGDEAGFVAELGRRLRMEGLPVDRLILHRRTMHPEILARAVAWAPHEPIEIYDRDHGLDLSENFVSSPLHQVMETGESLVVRLGPSEDHASARGLPLRGRHLIELVILPVGNAEGPVTTLTIGTARAGGFGADDKHMLAQIELCLRTLMKRPWRRTRRRV